jgi:ankyrin repeat protein
MSRSHPKSRRPSELRLGSILPLAERILIGQPARRTRTPAPAARISRLVSLRLLADRPVSLHMAAADGDVGRVRNTIDRGVPVDARDAFSGRTALHVATIARQRTIAALLLGRGADVNAVSNLGKTPLHFAASATSDGYGPDTALMRLFLEQGTEVDAKSLDRGRTPLHEAVASSLADGVTLLASTDILLDPDGASGHRTETEIEMLHEEENGPHFAAATLLLAYGTDVNTRDDRGWTALHHVTTLYAPDNSRELAALLLLHGADPGLRTFDDNQTVVDHARASRLTDLVALLERTA